MVSYKGILTDVLEDITITNHDEDRDDRTLDQQYRSTRHSTVTTRRTAPQLSCASLRPENYLATWFRNHGKSLLQKIPFETLVGNEAYLQRFLGQNADSLVYDRTSSGWASSNWDHSTAETLPQDFINDVKAKMLGERRLATTRNEYVRLVPASSQSGDAIATLLGCSMPVILRRHVQVFRIVGVCGLRPWPQDGEATEGLEGGKRQTESIFIG